MKHPLTEPTPPLVAIATEPNQRLRDLVLLFGVYEGTTRQIPIWAEMLNLAGGEEMLDVMAKRCYDASRPRELNPNEEVSP